MSAELSAADLVGDAPDIGGLASGELTTGTAPKGLLPLTPCVDRPKEKPPDDASERFAAVGGEGNENPDEEPVSGFSLTGELTGVVLSAGLGRRSARGVVVPSADGERASGASANTYDESVSPDGSSSSSVSDPCPSPSELCGADMINGSSSCSSSSSSTPSPSSVVSSLSPTSCWLFAGLIGFSICIGVRAGLGPEGVTGPGKSVVVVDIGMAD